MPKWVVYCRQCNRPSTFTKIDPAVPELEANLMHASPVVKKPILADSNRWECPFCKKRSRVQYCDLTYSYI